MEITEKKQVILIIDNIQKDVTFLRTLLKNEYTIRSTSNWEAALNTINSRTPPVLIIYDAMTTDIDARDLCRTIKSDPRTWNIPVIFIIPEQNEENETKAFQAGAADYVAKPFNPIVVNARVKTYAEMKNYRDHLENSIYRDGLTSIPNRRRFDEYFDASWNFAARENMPLSLIKISIDDFIKFNDDYGQQAADGCIVQIASKLTASVKRKTDLVIRYGRDEFFCILPNTRIDGAIIVAEQFRNAVLSLRIPNGQPAFNGYVTISQGIATVTPANGLEPQILVSTADDALKKTKDGKRNQINCKSL